jgi:hypothetical protein
MDNSEKNQVGRPSELIETLETAKQYLNGGYEQVNEVIPSIAGLACYTGKSRNNIYEYGKQSIEFKYILDAILQLQESKLINEGLKGNFNSTIAKLILSKHGYSDKQEIEHSGNAQSPVIVISGD